MKQIVVFVGVVAALMIATARAGGGENYFDAAMGDSWNGAGWYVTDTIHSYQVPLKGPFGSTGDCRQKLPNAPNADAESHSWYCQYFEADPFPPNR